MKFLIMLVFVSSAALAAEVKTECLAMNESRSHQKKVELKKKIHIGVSKQ